MFYYLSRVDDSIVPVVEEGQWLKKMYLIKFKRLIECTLERNKNLNEHQALILL